MDRDTLGRMLSIVMFRGLVKRPVLELGFLFAKVYRTYRTTFRVRM